MFEDGVWVFVKEHFIDGHVERWNHFLGVRYQLTVKIGVELAQVFTVEVEERLTHDTYLCTHRHTYLCTHKHNTYTHTHLVFISVYLGSSHNHDSVPDLSWQHGGSMLSQSGTLSSFSASVRLIQLHMWKKSKKKRKLDHSKIRLFLVPMPTFSTNSNVNSHLTF